MTSCTCLVFAADRRLVVLPIAARHGVPLIEFPYDSLTSVACARGARSAQLSIASPDAEVFVRRMHRDASDALLEVLRARMQLSTSQASCAHHGPALSTAASKSSTSGQLDGPSRDYVADKSDFGSSRIRRWFARDWTSY